MKETNLDNANKTSLSPTIESYKESLNKLIDEFISTLDFSSKDYCEKQSAVKSLKKEDLIVKYKEEIRVNYTNTKLLSFLTNTVSQLKIELESSKNIHKSIIKRLSKLIFILSILLTVSILIIIGIVIGFSI